MSKLEAPALLEGEIMSTWNQNVELILRRLAESEPTKEGYETIPYQELMTIIGTDDKLYMRRVYYSAASMALQQLGFVFDCVYRTGYKRLTDTEIQTKSVKRRNQINKIVRKSITELQQVKLSTLTIPQQRKYSAQLATLQATEMLTRSQTVLTVEEKINLRRVKPRPSSMIIEFVGLDDVQVGIKK